MQNVGRGSVRRGAGYCYKLIIYSGLFPWIKWLFIICRLYKIGALMPGGARQVWTQSAKRSHISIASLSSTNPRVGIISIPNVNLERYWESKLNKSANIANQTCWNRRWCPWMQMHAALGEKLRMNKGWRDSTLFLLPATTWLHLNVQFTRHLILKELISEVIWTLILDTTIKNVITGSNQVIVQICHVKTS